MDLTRFDVSIAGDGIDLEKAAETGDFHTYRVTIMHADMLVAEATGHRYGLGEMTAAPLAYSTLWCWCALTRMGVPVPEFPLFKARVISVDKIKGDVILLDPTSPGPDTGSP